MFVFQMILSILLLVALFLPAALALFGNIADANRDYMRFKDSRYGIYW